MMRSRLGNASTRLLALVRGLALPSEPASADPGDVQQRLSEQQRRLEALGPPDARATPAPCSARSVRVSASVNPSA